MRFINEFENIELDLPISTESKKIDDNLDELQELFHDFIKETKLMSVFKLTERYGE